MIGMGLRKHPANSRLNGIPTPFIRLARTLLRDVSPLPSDLTLSREPRLLFKSR